MRSGFAAAIIARCLVAVTFMVVFPAGSVAAAPSPKGVSALAQDVDRHYNHLRSLNAQFTEIYRGGGMERTESGTLWLKKPGKMRWEYRSPREKLFVGDGKDAWFYVPGDQQVRRAPMNKLDDLQSPIALLLGKSKLEKELRGLSLVSDVAPWTPGGVLLAGVPIAMEERVNRVMLEITPGKRIARILIEERDGAVTEYRFSEQTENLAVGDERFRFSPPPGTEVVEGAFAP